MTRSNLDAAAHPQVDLSAEVQAFASRIPVETAARAADIYERAVTAAADLLEAMIDRELLAKELEERYRADRPEGVEGGDWLVAIEDYIGLGAALNVMVDAAGSVEMGTACSGEVMLLSEMAWPETAWPLSFPRPETRD